MCINNIIIKKIDLEKEWLDEDWDLFSNSEYDLYKSNFKSGDVYEIYNCKILVGLVEYELMFDSKTCYIYHFEIKKAFRGKGLGKKAIKKLLCSINQLTNIETVELDPQNDKVARFWCKCGFRKCNNGGTLFIRL